MCSPFVELWIVQLSNPAAQDPLYGKPHRNTSDGGTYTCIKWVSHTLYAYTYIVHTYTLLHNPDLYLVVWIYFCFQRFDALHNVATLPSSFQFNNAATFLASSFFATFFSFIILLLLFPFFAGRISSCSSSIAWLNKNKIRKIIVGQWIIQNVIIYKIESNGCPERFLLRSIMAALLIAPPPLKPLDTIVPWYSPWTPGYHSAVMTRKAAAIVSNAKSLRLRKSLPRMLAASIVIRSESGAPITPISGDEDRHSVQRNPLSSRNNV